jgi:hypothetical protein
MDMEPDSEWELEVVRRVLAGEDEEAALTAVLQESLGAGDPRILIGIGRAMRPIPALARRYIAAMFDESPQSNEPIPTYFDVERRERTVTDEARRRREWIEAGKLALDNNQDPGWMFGFVLARALCVGHPGAQRGSLLPDIPIKITIRPRVQRRRAAKPDVAINRFVLRVLVDRLVMGGMSAQSAIEQVAGQTNQDGRAVKRAFYREA